MTEVRALLVTDIVDSTRIAAEHGDAGMAGMSAAHDRVVRELLQRWRGREIDKSDGFLLLFDSAADAAGCAQQMHQELHALVPTLKARAGVHVGDVALRPNPPDAVARGAKPLEVEGIAKAVAARTMSVARGGQTLLTAPARDALGDAGIAVVPRGHWRLKGIAQEIELFEAPWPGGPTEPPADTEKAYRVIRHDGRWLPAREIHHSLPAEPDAFVGRRDALRELASLLDGGARLVTVHGLGGMGKTRLALHLAWHWLGDFPGGVWFCDLAAARNLDGVLQAVSRGLDVPLGLDDPVSRLGDAIAGRGRCLLLLDNFEQVATLAEATVTPWLTRAPQARFVATSRELLRVPGEVVLALQPMDTRDGAALFGQRARAATGKAAEGDADPEVHALVEMLDGLPLAIELAAARRTVMSVRQLRQRMGERLKLLAARGGRVERQSTLRATFDWSWDLLGAAERDLLAQMSVFEGGATLAAIEAVVDLSDHAGPPEPLDVLQSLVEKSWVRRLAGDRFDLLQSVQDYAAQHLAAMASTADRESPSAAGAARARHRRHFAALSPEGATAGRCAELANLIAAVRSAAHDDDLHSAVGALEGTWEALRMRGPFRVGSALVEQVRAMPGIDAALSARIDRIAGWMLKAGGRGGDARARFDAALASARTAGDLPQQGRILLHLGDLELVEGRTDLARRTLTDALGVGRRVRDRRLEHEALNSLGNVAYYTGNLELAATSYGAALRIAQDTRNRRAIGVVAGGLGNVFQELGRIDDARAHYEQALGAARDIGDRLLEANTRCNLGLMLHEHGQDVQAQAQLQEVLAAAREMGHARLECVVLCNLGMVAMALGQADEAHVLLQSALRQAREHADRRTEGQVLGYLGLSHARRGELAPAGAALESGRRLLEEVSDRLSLGVLLCAVAEFRHLADAPQEAAMALDDAAAIASDLACKPESELRQCLSRVERILRPATAVPATMPPA